MNRLSILTMTAILSALLTLISCGGRELPYFDGEAAFRFLVAQTEFGPRNPGSEGAELCKEYLISELTKTADRVSRQPFTYTDTDLDTTFNMTNIIASFNLEPRSGRRILLCAHWDTRPMADEDPDPAKRDQPILGANDGASGVAVLLQVAAIMKENPPPFGVDIVLFDGEDYGEAGNHDKFCLGSKHFARTKGGYNPEFGILLDLVGDKDLEFPIEGNSLQYAPALTRRLWDKAEELGLSAFKNERGPYIYDDHIPLNQAGLKTVNIIDFDYEYWHTVEDTPDKCSPESLTQSGRLLMAVIYE